MIGNEDVLFIHVPKTGGMSMTYFLAKALPRPVYYWGPPDPELANADIIHIESDTRHQSVEEASQVLPDVDVDIHQIPLILGAIRNPYAIEVSRFAYLRAGHPWDEGHDQTLALVEDFETFALRSGRHDPSKAIESYLLFDNSLLPNMRILRFEDDIETETRKALAEVGVHTDAPFPWENRSHHLPYCFFYTASAEEAVYRKYRWLFESGFYSRLPPSAWPTSPIAGQRRGVPVVGPVALIEDVRGFWPHDSWAEPTLSFRVGLDRPVGAVAVEGWIPERLEGQELHLTIGPSGLDETVRFSEPRDFNFRMRCSLTPGMHSVRLTASAGWSPSTTGSSEDERTLAFVLKRLRLEVDSG